MRYQFDAIAARSAGVVRLSGSLDLLTAGEVRDRIQGLVSEGFTRLVVDLDEVKSMDSSGLGALVSGLRATRHVGGDLRIARPRVSIRNLLGLSQLDAVFTSYGTVEHALADY